MTKKPELVKAINTYLQNNQSHYIPKKLTFSPSKSTSPCKRKVFYSYLRIQPDFKHAPKTMRIFDTGNHLHNMMKDWVRLTYGLIDYRDVNGKIPLHWVTKQPDPEFPVYDEQTSIRGKIDGVGIINNELWIYEMKSIKNFDGLTGPKTDHLQQAMSYVYLFQDSLREGKYKHIKELTNFKEVQGIVFLYLNKTTSELMDFVVEKTFAPYEELLNTVNSTLLAVEEGLLPMKTQDYCMNCEFRIKCKNEFNPVKK
jgi:hypothetical protein